MALPRDTGSCMVLFHFVRGLLLSSGRTAEKTSTVEQIQQRMRQHLHRRRKKCTQRNGKRECLDVVLRFGYDDVDLRVSLDRIFLRWFHGDCSSLWCYRWSQSDGWQYYCVRFPVRELCDVIRPKYI